MANRQAQKENEKHTHITSTYEHILKKVEKQYSTIIVLFKQMIYAYNWINH